MDRMPESVEPECRLEDGGDSSMKVRHVGFFLANVR